LSADAIYTLNKGTIEFSEHNSTPTPLPNPEKPQTNPQQPAAEHAQPFINFQIQNPLS
jgi:hypothetical protein